MIKIRESIMNNRRMNESAQAQKDFLKGVNNMPKLAKWLDNFLFDNITNEEYRSNKEIGKVLNTNLRKALPKGYSGELALYPDPRGIKSIAINLTILSDQSGPVLEYRGTANGRGFTDGRINRIFMPEVGVKAAMDDIGKLDLDGIIVDSLRKVFKLK